MATAFPLVLRKAYGRRAGLVALAVGLAMITLLMILGAAGLLPGVFPVMVLLGPLMVGQYTFWRHRLGPERTTWQYQQAEPRSNYGKLAMI